MATLAGTQGNFANAIKETIELNFDAKKAYEFAETQLKNPTFKEKTREFRQNHERHIQDLSQLLINHGETPLTSLSIKKWLTKGKTALASFMDNNMILFTKQNNEGDTNTAYERMNVCLDIVETFVYIGIHYFQ